mgnify:CR=1 FL=1
MYKFIKAIIWIIRFKKEKLDFECAAEFYRVHLPDGEEKDKNVGASLMSAEQAQDKYKSALKILLGK